MSNSFTNNQLQLDIIEDDNAVAIQFLGKSILRDPNEFVMPILLKYLAEAKASGRRVVLDFCQLAYMNSSTLTPIIKILEKVRVGEGSLTIRYQKTLKWQHISFSALAIFQTKDLRIEIKGVE